MYSILASVEICYALRRTSRGGRFNTAIALLLSCNCISLLLSLTVMHLHRRARRHPQLQHLVKDRCVVNKNMVQLLAPSSRSTSKCSPLWRHFLWLLALNACGSILSIVAWVARYQQKVFSFASKEAKKGSAEYWSGQV